MRFRDLDMEPTLTLFPLKALSYLDLHLKGKIKAIKKETIINDGTE